MRNPEKYAISLDKEMPLFDALDDECSDLRAWAASSFVLAVSESEEIMPNSHIDHFLYFLLENQDTTLGKAILRQLRSSDHPWINTYLSKMVERTSVENTDKMLTLFDLFERLHLFDPHQAIPTLIESLGEKSDAPRRAIILKTIAFLEQPRVSTETRSE
ncbi:hypothetical protein MUP77_23855, partial [Candidatus Bathyarchaeota archaeon]|nr:hypothetical protein [Candidatus Bathyarchaeota archaeon]